MFSHHALLRGPPRLGRGPMPRDVKASVYKEPKHPICHLGSNHTYVWTTHMYRSNDITYNHCAYGAIPHLICVQTAIGAPFCQRRSCAHPSFHLVAERVLGVSTARAARNGHSVARPRSLRSTRAPDGFRRCETVLGCTLPKEVSETGEQNGENWRAQRQSLRYDHLPFNRRLVDCSPGRPAGSRRWESQSMCHPTRWLVERAESVLGFLLRIL